MNYIIVESNANSNKFIFAKGIYCLRFFLDFVCYFILYLYNVLKVTIRLLVYIILEYNTQKQTSIISLEITRRHFS